MSDTPEQAKTEETPDLEQALDEAAEAVAVQTSELEELGGGAQADNVGIDNLLDVPVKVTVHVGRAQVTLGELVKMTAGSLLELDRESHQPADILVNGKVVAHGEIVTINDYYGVRITSVDS